MAADKLFVAANAYSKKNYTKFSVVRYGNVMASRGSIIPYLINNYKNKYINVTDKRMTRFNITLNQSIKFVSDCFKRMIGGEIFVPKLSSYRVTELVRAICLILKLKL